MRLLKLLLGLIVLVAFAAAIYLYDPLPANPSAAELSAASQLYSAEVVRDEWGIPHIKGKRDADTSFGLAYVHAEDDFETIQEVVAATRGLSARYKGAGAAPTDYVVGLLDVWNIVEAKYDSDVVNDVKELAEAYTAGINLYAAENPDKTWPGLAPFKPEDVIAGFIFKTPFFYGLDQTLTDLFDETRESEIALDPSGGVSAFEMRKRSGAELGSNAMAISAARSGEDTTRLLINSHQPMTGPVAWYEAHLQSDEGLDIQGGIFPGTPVILHGFNKHLGWANTVNHIDLADVYQITRNPDNEYQYKLDGEWRDFERDEVQIKVKLWGPFVYTAKRELLKTEHGPVIESGGNTYALRYAGRGEIRQLEQYYRLNQATDFDSFTAAMAMNALPSINYVYADKEDNIAFVHNGQYPNRIEGWDWSLDLPGDRSDLIWDGYRPYDSIPKLVNPESGLLFNANNTPYIATDGPDNMRPEDFPSSMGLATNQTNRAHRLVDLNDGVSPITKEQLLKQKFDLEYSTSSNQYKIVQTLINGEWEDENLAAAAEHLKGWDLRTDMANRHAALPATVFMRLRQSSNPDDYELENLVEPFANAVSLLERKFGRIDPEWGEVNRLQRGDVDLPMNGGPDILRAIYSVGLDNDQTYATHGDTWMAIVEWQDGEFVNADVMHQFGSATLDETSPHYADQAPLFAAQEWRKAEFDIEKLRASATRIYTLGKSEE